MFIPGTSLCRNSAWRELWRGSTPTMTGRPNRRAFSRKRSSTFSSKTVWGAKKGGRVAAQAEDVADAQHVGADHVGVDGQGVAVAGGVVHDDLDAELALEEDGHSEGRHADLGGGAIADVDGG